MGMAFFIGVTGSCALNSAEVHYDIIVAGQSQVQFKGSNWSDTDATQIMAIINAGQENTLSTRTNFGHYAAHVQQGVQQGLVNSMTIRTNF